MAIRDERFAFGLGTVVGIQALGTANVTNLTLTGLLMRTGNFRSQRQFELLMTVDGETYKIVGDFEDDTFHRQTIKGAPISYSSDSQGQR